MTECRICCSDGELVAPCDCKHNGAPTLAHRSCVQHWIELRPLVVRSNPACCEVCGTEWKQPYQIPAMPVDQTPEERAAMYQRAEDMIFLAWTRLEHGIARPTDRDVVNSLGPLIDGPWRQNKKTCRMQ
jgi:hypothetical protein